VAISIVAPVTDKEGIVRMRVEQVLYFFRGDGAGRLAVAGAAGTVPLPSESHRLEKTFALADGISLS
jgi:hypothetical protein